MTTYKHSRLCFRADVIEPLTKQDSFCVRTHNGTFAMTKAEFYRVFDNVVKTKSYLKGRMYHYPKPPRKADRFRVGRMLSD